MSSENSVVARKLENYFDIKNHHEEAAAPDKLEPGLLAQMTVIALMSVACTLTKTTLFLTRLIKKLES